VTEDQGGKKWIIFKASWCKASRNHRRECPPLLDQLFLPHWPLNQHWNTTLLPHRPHRANPKALATSGTLYHRLIGVFPTHSSMLWQCGATACTRPHRGSPATATATTPATHHPRRFDREARSPCSRSSFWCQAEIRRGQRTVALHTQPPAKVA
jgi:hypothetical protein